jgi:hypothetical protein
LLKSIPVDTFVPTKAAHSTAAPTTVKHLSKISFLLNRLSFKEKTPPQSRGGILTNQKTESTAQRRKNPGSACGTAACTD